MHIPGQPLHQLGSWTVEPSGERAIFISRVRVQRVKNIWFLEFVYIILKTLWSPTCIFMLVLPISWFCIQTCPFLKWFPIKAREFSLSCYLTSSCVEKRWIHAFIKGTSVKWAETTLARIWTLFVDSFFHAVNHQFKLSAFETRTAKLDQQFPKYLWIKMNTHIKIIRKADLKVSDYGR